MVLKWNKTLFSRWLIPTEQLFKNIWSVNVFTGKISQIALTQYKNNVDVDQNFLQTLQYFSHCPLAHQHVDKYTPYISLFSEISRSFVKLGCYHKLFEAFLQYPVLNGSCKNRLSHPTMLFGRWFFPKYYSCRILLLSCAAWKLNHMHHYFPQWHVYDK